MNKLVQIAKKLEELNVEIESYEPPTVWEAANGRYLKYMKRRRSRYEKAIERLEQREKYGQTGKKVSGDHSCWDVTGCGGCTCGGGDV